MVKWTYFTELYNYEGGIIINETNNLLAYKKDIFSQNGEDGVIKRIFDIIGTKSGTCCEFGAWDGMHLSNTRQLILNGWMGILIEADETKCISLNEKYKTNKKVFCINKYVDNDKNKLSAILCEAGLTDIAKNLDFLSIDVDGTDYEIFKGLDIYPKVICVEVNAGHSPSDSRTVDREVAKNNVGQPLSLFSKTAAEKGFILSCYTGNAFYIRKDIYEQYKNKIPAISDESAYTDFLDSLSVEGREWLFLVNLGLVPPFYKYNNPFLNRNRLKIKHNRTMTLIMKRWLKQKINMMIK